MSPAARGATFVNPQASLVPVPSHMPPDTAQVTQGSLEREALSVCSCVAIYRSARGLVLSISWSRRLAIWKQTCKHCEDEAEKGAEKLLQGHTWAWAELVDPGSMGELLRTLLFVAAARLPLPFVHACSDMSLPSSILMQKAKNVVELCCRVGCLVGENVPGMTVEKNLHLLSLCVCEQASSWMSRQGSQPLWGNRKALQTAQCCPLFCSSKDVNKLTEGHNTSSNIQEGFLGPGIFLHFNFSGNDFVFQQLSWAQASPLSV